MSIWNLLNFNSLLKILFLYSTCIFYTILFYFNFSGDILSQDSSKPKIAIYSDSSRIGEHVAYIRSIKALNKLGYQYMGASFEEYSMHFFFTKHIFQTTTYLLHKIIKPDFSINLTHHTNIIPPGLSLLYLNVPRDISLDVNKGFEPRFPHLKDFKGYVDLYSFVNDGNEELKKTLVKLGKKDSPIFTAYLAQNDNLLPPPAEYKNLVLTGSLWGCSRNSYRVKATLKKLSDNGHLKAYGLKEHLKFLGDGYLGSIEDHPSKSNIVDKILQAQNDLGISLLIHNLDHKLEGLPTNRIGEAIMANAVIISDNHPFIKKHFGNNVLYFDVFAEPNEMYDQIAEHLAWIKSNPEKAKQMTQNNHEIFAKKFTLEKQLVKLIEQVMEYKKGGE
jgi:hypothetical protein